MTPTLPKVARIVQTTLPVLPAACFIASFHSLQAEAETHMGPPNYLPLEFFVIVFAIVFALPAALLWLWKTAGWAISIAFDGIVALLLLYAVATDLSDSSRPQFAVDLIFLCIATCFVCLAVTIASRPSRIFFGISSATGEVL